MELPKGHFDKLKTLMKEVKLPYAKREELFTFLDISIDVLKMHMEGLSVYNIFEKYVKQRIEEHFIKNNYLDNQYVLLAEGFSFSAFGNVVIFDSIIYNKMDSHAVLKQVCNELGTKDFYIGYPGMSEKFKEIQERNSKEVSGYKKFAYIHFYFKDFEILKFFTMEEVYQNIFNSAKEEMEKHKESRYKTIVEFKQKYFKDRLNEIYPSVVKESGFIINWYLLINEYVEGLEELIQEEDKNIEPLNSKVTMLLVRTLCNHLDIETRHESFYRLMSRITGKDYEAAVKYLTDTKMQCSDSAYAKNWINAIEILEPFKVREPQPTIGGQVDEPQDNLMPIIHKLLKDLNNLKELDNSVLIDKIDTLNRKYKNKN